MIACVIRFERPPSTDDELHAAMVGVFGIDIPRKKICPDHESPFTAFAHAFFARKPGVAVWYGSRGTGKSYLLAALGLAKTTFHMGNTTILGGSIHQSNNVYQHMATMMRHPNAPSGIVENFTKSELLFTNHTWVKPLSASQTSVRGPHPLLHLLDEIDEMDWDVYTASLGQAMRQPNALGVELDEYVVKSSTWQKIDGTMSKVIAEHRERGLPVFTWCYREQLKPHGWMDPDFIERKKASVPAEFWRVEYELGEPSGENSVFDVGRLREVFRSSPEIPQLSRHSDSDHLWVYEAPKDTASYAIGVDLAKSKDWTVALVARTDVTPMRVVAVKKVARIPWPEIIDQIKTLRRVWNRAEMGHDGTGLGGVVTDLLGEHSRRYLFVGDQRKRLLNEMIADVENGRFVLPMGENPLWDKLRATTVADVWGGPGAGSSHLPDETAALAVLNAVVGSRATGVLGRPVPKKSGDAASSWEQGLTGSSGKTADATPWLSEVDDGVDDGVFVPML